jgi:hypothetical protein
MDDFHWEGRPRCFRLGRDGGFYPRLSPRGNASEAARFVANVAGGKQGKGGSQGRLRRWP